MPVERKTLRHLAPEMPGVYRMYDISDKILYIGKARSLKQRLISYFSQNNLSQKTRSLMEKVEKIDWILTENEDAALLLEAKLIKKHKPRYNILLRDDKSYPYLCIIEDEGFPYLKIAYFKQMTQQVLCYGPYANALAVKQTLEILQKVFLLRQCPKSVFKYRSRPCLQYQIDLCSAPCVGKIDKQVYREKFSLVKLCLEGKSNQVIEHLVKKMQSCSDKEDYEQAKQYRDHICSLQRLRGTQYVKAKTNNIDYFLYDKDKNLINCLCIREGYILRHYISTLKNTGEQDASQILSTFLMHEYILKKREELLLDAIVINQPIQNKAMLQSLLVGQTKKIIDIPGIMYANLYRVAEKNMLEKHTICAERDQVMLSKSSELAQALFLNKALERVECFDISHMQGSETVASCVVFNQKGPVYDEYRVFRIHTARNDDYASMKEVLERRCNTIEKNKDFPDLWIIDGGKNHLMLAASVLQAKSLSSIMLLSIGKDITRKSSLDQIWQFSDSNSKILKLTRGARQFVQFIRDEAHRYARMAYRKRHRKQLQVQILENIPGIGPSRKKLLIQYFGGLRGLRNASAEDIAQVPGIGAILAKSLYLALRQ